MHFIPLSDIKIEDRQRTQIEEKPLNELKRSILSKGLLHPPVVSREEDGSIRLRAGERRLRAMAALHAEGHNFRHNDIEVPLDAIPVTYTSELSEPDLIELELEENLCREDISWKDEVEAKAKLHRLRQSQNPNQTIRETGKEIAKLRGTSAEGERSRLHEALILSENMHNPRVQRAKSQTQAIKELLDENEQKFKARLTALSKKVETPHKLIHADCREAFSQIQPSTISTIICDPPYGIAAHQAGQESKHFYDDSSEYALEICEFIIREGFKLCTPRAILFMFCDIDHFVRLRTYAGQHAWSTFRTPIIWNKEVGGRAPWGKAGFQRSYEVILFAVKGQDELLYSGGNDILSFKQDSKSDRTHAANKPISLLSHLIRLSTLPGETILDPCCGSAPILTAADKNKVKVIGIEKDETYYSQALARLNKEFKEEEEDENGTKLPLL